MNTTTLLTNNENREDEVEDYQFEDSYEEFTRVGDEQHISVFKQSLGGAHSCTPVSTILAILTTLETLSFYNT